MGDVKLFSPLAQAMAAALALVLRRQAHGPDWWLALLEMIGLVLGVGAALSLGEWIVDRSVRAVYHLRQAMAITERVALLEQISRMDREQIEYAKTYVPVLELVAGDLGPVQWLRVLDGAVPMSFVEEFVGLSQDGYLCPVRRYSEGSSERGWAEKFTRWAVQMGWADEAGGNRPAKWIDQQRALHAIGLE